MTGVLAFDLSLTSTGVAMPDGSTHVIRTNAADPLEIRLDVIVRGVGDAYFTDCRARRADLVVIEDFVTKGKFSGAVAPVHGAVRWWLHTVEATVVVTAPASVKLYASGKGNCDKDAMGIAAMKRAGLDFSGRNDECDAWWLRAMALDAYGTPVVDMPAAHRAALEKVKWPDLEGDR